uniref:Uncharacterized protein n=1 Tax=Arundo donax TaxID=35708 RepID=A0A0A8ZT55_ARUDO
MLRSCTLPEFGDEQGEERNEEFIVEWDTSDLDVVVDDIVGARTSLLGAATMSAFADEDITDGIFGVELNGDDIFWSSDDEDEDGYL